MKTYLITGGAGFIGSNIAEALVKEDYKVRVLDNLSTGHLSNLEQIKDQISFYNGDIRDSDLLLKASEDCDVIFHEAAVVSVPQTIEQPVESAFINDIGTLQVFEAAKKNKVKRVVFASSSAIYGDDPELPKKENMLPRPKSPYSAQKIMGEHYARLYHELYGVETVCLRYFNVYGPKQDPSSPYSGVISIFMKKALEREIPIIYGTGEQYRDFIFIHDVVKANLLAAITEGISGKVFNIGTENFVSINEVWNFICDMLNLDIKPDYKAHRPGDILESAANIDLAKKLMKFEPEYKFKDGLKKTLEWFVLSKDCPMQTL
ncbi:putative UDP-glucose 4-epimerase [Candidatus Magnetomoraceae bacterium gMMP-15]